MQYKLQWAGRMIAVTERCVVRGARFCVHLASPLDKGATLIQTSFARTYRLKKALRLLKEEVDSAFQVLQERRLKGIGEEHTVCGSIVVVRDGSDPENDVFNLFLQKQKSAQLYIPQGYFPATQPSLSICWAGKQSLRREPALHTACLDGDGTSNAADSR